MSENNKTEAPELKITQPPESDNLVGGIVDKAKLDGFVKNCVQSTIKANQAGKNELIMLSGGSASNVGACVSLLKTLGVTDKNATLKLDSESILEHKIMPATNLIEKMGYKHAEKFPRYKQAFREILKYATELYYYELAQYNATQGTNIKGTVVIDDHFEKVTEKNDISFEEQVGKLVDIIYPALDNITKHDTMNAINRLLGQHITHYLTEQDFENQEQLKTRLIADIGTKYQKNTGGFNAFLDEVKSGLSDNNPLKTYEKPKGLGTAQELAALGKKYGAEVGYIGVYVDPRVALNRAAARAADGKDVVSPAFQIGTYRHLPINWRDMCADTNVNVAVLVHNNRELSKVPHLIARKVNSNAVEILNPLEYFCFEAMESIKEGVSKASKVFVGDDGKEINLEDEFIKKQQTHPEGSFGEMLNSLKNGTFVDRVLKSMGLFNEQESALAR